MATEFEKYAIKHLGISSTALGRYTSFTNAYINPSIIEERQMNVAVMDVFSRLMMDRIIFLGVPISDDVANIIQAQLLFLDSTDSTADIQLYINSPGGVVYAGLGIYDTMQLVNSDVATICTGMAGRLNGIRAPLRRRQRQTQRSPPLKGNDSPAYGRSRGSGFGYRDYSQRDSQTKTGALSHHLASLRQEHQAD